MASKVQKVRIVCVSDTHNAHPSISLPKGDVLIHAGDLTNQGSYNELKKAIDWISQADFQVKIIVAGNHDLSLDPEYTIKHKQGWHVTPEKHDIEACRDLVISYANMNIVYLQHTDAVIHVGINAPLGKRETVALRVFGSPYSPDRGEQNWAFQYAENVGESLWDAVPGEIDVLITHTPPQGFCDASRHWKEGGCSSLTLALPRVRPLLHVCGHCHEGRGAVVLGWDDEDSNVSVLHTWQDPGIGNKKQSIVDLTGKVGGGHLQRGRHTAIVNASIVASSHGRSKSFNKPIVIDLPIQQQTCGASTAKKDGTSAAGA